MEDQYLTVIPQDHVLTTIQKLSLNSPVLDIHNFKYILVSLSEDFQVLCRLHKVEHLHARFCNLDTSVINAPRLKLNTAGLPSSKLDIKLPTLVKINETKILEKSLVSLKTAKISVVFEDVERTGLWCKKRSQLLDLLQSILEMFVLTERCVVNLKNLKPNRNAGIFCMIVQTNKLSGGIGQVTPRTKVEIVSIASKLEFDYSQTQSNSTPLAGVSKYFYELKELLDQNLENKAAASKDCIQPSNKVLVAGPSGCGKTSLVKRVCEECQTSVVTVMGGTCADSVPGEAETKLREAFARASAIPKGVLLLDQIDSLCPKRSDVTQAHIARLSTQLLTLLEDPNGPSIVIATSSRPQMLDPAVRRPGRLDREIFMVPPTQLERKAMLKALLQDQKPPNIEALSDEGAYLTPGYVAADLALLARETALQVWRKGGDVSKWSSELRSAVALMKPAALRGGLGVITTEETSFDQLGGLEDIKLRLQAAIEWPLSHPQAFTRLGLSRPKGVLLYGPPGCAKTSLVRAMASASGTTFLAISAAELYSPFVGDTERSLVDLFQRARAAAPTILFIDEIDALVGGRGSGSDKSSGVQERVLSTLLVELDGTTVPSSGGGVMIVAATNRPDLLDAALMRPGRLDKLVFVPAPNLPTRLAILHKITANMPLLTDVNLHEIAQRTEFFSGADLQNLCREAALNALVEQGMRAENISKIHFEAAFQHSRPSLTQSQLDWYHSYEPGK